jgi:RecA/RadA recombinase
MASIQPKDLQNADLDKEARIGALARLMHRVCPQLAASAKQGNCSIILINQIREKIGVMFGNPETTPGGRSVGFYSSLRLRLSQVSSRDSRGIVKDDEEIGIRSNVLVKKSRFGPPYQEAILPIYYTDEKPYPFDMLLDIALSNKIIKCKSKKDKITGDRVQFFTLEGFSDIDGVMGIDDLKGCLLANKKALMVIYEHLDKKGKILDSDIHLYIQNLNKEEPTEDLPHDTEANGP